TLVNEVKETGYYSTTFDASKLSSGIYFAKLQSGDKVQLKKMSLIK
ncbi:MAG TPA: peptidase S8, partial [Bacteroidetes bacterium]|nr:peptidase S8 [Bacteroidota bacterium]